MNPLYLSWGLTVFTFLNVWLIGNKRREGFLVGLAAQPVWVVFDIMTGAYGLLPVGLLLGYLYIRGYVKWGSA